MIHSGLRARPLMSSGILTFFLFYTPVRHAAPQASPPAVTDIRMFALHVLSVCTQFGTFSWLKVFWVSEKISRQFVDNVGKQRHATLLVISSMVTRPTRNG